MHLYAQSDIPVDLHTGTAQISIPLAQVSDRDVSVPVVLSYATTGVRVDDYEGLVGIGWQLSAGGMISREVRGLPDDFQGLAGDSRSGWLHDGTIAFNVGNMTSNSALWANLNVHHESLKDTEPDLFYFNVGGISGRFVFDNNKQIRLLSYQDLKIEFNSLTGYFTITTNTDVVYHFYHKETTIKETESDSTVDHLQRDYHLYDEPVNYTSAWRLSKISSAKGANIYFNYNNITHSYEKPTEVMIKSMYNNGEYTKKTLYTTQYRVTSMVISSISSPTKNVNFETREWNYNQNYDYPNSRQNNAQVIKAIQVNALTGYGTSKIKRVYFSYKNVKSKTVSAIINDPNPRYSQRVYLSTLREYTDCGSMPPYVFSYAGGLPPYNSNEQDVWGYYNSNGLDDYDEHPNDTYLHPAIYVYPSLPLAERYRYSAITGQAGQVIITGADRDIETSGAAAAGILKIVDYPSGGSATLSYENHQYTETVGQNTLTLYGPGVRVSSIHYSDNIPQTTGITKNYEYSEGKLSNKPKFTIPTAFYTDPVGGANKTKTELGSTYWDYLTIRSTENLSGSGYVGYKSATVKQTGQGSSVYAYDMPALYGETTQGDWTPTTTHILQNNTSELGTIETGTFAYPYPNNTNYSFERGLLRKRTDYSEAGQKVKESDYHYQRLYKANTSTFHIVKGLFYDAERALASSLDNVYLFGHYSLLTEAGKVLSQRIDRMYDNDDDTKYVTSTTDYHYQGANHTALSKMTATAQDGTITTSDYKYVYDYTVPSGATDPQAVMIKTMQDNNLSGRLIERTSKVKYVGQSEKTIGGSITKFDDFTDAIVRPYQQLVLRAEDGLTNFVSSTISSNQFVNDARYEEVQTIKTYDEYGNICTVEGRNKKTGAFHYGHKGRLPIVAIANASAEEVVFSSFETTTGHEFETMGLKDHLNVRTGDYAFSLNQLSSPLSATVKKATGDYALFSTWINATASGTLTIDLKPDISSVAIVTKDVNYVNTNGEWIYVEHKFLTAGLPTNFYIEVSSSEIQHVVLDDMAFYPSQADLVSSTYDQINGQTSVTNANGITTYYDYDNLGRVKYIRDQDRNIVQTKAYGFANAWGESLNPDFDHQEVTYHNISTGFTALQNCLEGATYSWSVYHDGVLVPDSEQSNTSQSYTHTFKLTAGVDQSIYMVRLDVSKAGYATQSRESEITVNRFTPPIMTICSTGPIMIDKCDLVAASVSTCASAPSQVGFTTFAISSVTGGDPGASYCFEWQLKRATESFWYSIDPADETATGWQEHADTQSYQIRCIMLNSTTGSCVFNPGIRTSDYVSNSISVTMYNSQEGCTEIGGGQ